MTEKLLHVQVAEALGCKPITGTADPTGKKYGWACVCGAPGRPHPAGKGPHSASGPCHNVAHYDTDWFATGPLIEQYRVAVRPTVDADESFEDWSEEEKAQAAKSWDAYLEHGYYRNTSPSAFSVGLTPLIAICNLILMLAKEGKLNPSPQAAPGSSPSAGAPTS